MILSAALIIVCFVRHTFISNWNLQNIEYPNTHDSLFALSVHKKHKHKVKSALYCAADSTGKTVYCKIG